VPFAHIAPSQCGTGLFQTLKWLEQRSPLFVVHKMFSTVRKVTPKAVSAGSRSMTFKAPVRDVKFIFDEVLNVYKYFPENAPQDTVEMVIKEMAKFAENTLHPIYQVGDEGCKWSVERVDTPKGWKEAYKAYVDGGWPSLPAATDFGGQGFPLTVDAVKTEFCAAANWTWFMYPMLSHGCMECLTEHAVPELKKKFLPKLISGDWTGTMCLTEPQSGSDLGLVKSTAKPTGDGKTYKISGTKIFISCGEHDWAENIIHLVLARLPDAPSGTKGISLFLVPKYKVKDDGTVDSSKKNAQCVGIEHKMGIKGSATCVISFEDSEGYLVGKPHNGMREMFAFMNAARLTVGTQGLGHAELSFQNALPYARDRLSGRAPTGALCKDKVADPIIVHPDIRRLLLKMKAFTEGGRALVYHTALVEDKVRWAKDEKEKHKFEGELGLLTPIVKAFLSETSFEICNDGIQVYGGHGYIKEWGMEQIVRDCRISMLYEGTTGIQSMDLIGRKILMNKGKDLATFAASIIGFCLQNQTQVQILPHILQVQKLATEWIEVAGTVMMLVQKDPSILQSAAVDFLHYSGYIVLAYMWLRMEVAALKALASKPSDPDFYKSKLQTADFYFARMLPKTAFYAATCRAPTKVLTQMKEEHFNLSS
jgi:alkylation response protein AidB-like acyl-CoA dehydrogenase